MAERRIKVLVIDDSALVRKALTEGLAAHPDIEVIGTAIDPYVARDKILSLNPDVLTLDIEMPRMDGISFLRLLMKHRPMPVVVISSLSAGGSAKALEALQAGAVDVAGKPDGPYSMTANCADIANKIRAAYRARVARLVSVPASPATAPSGSNAPGLATAGSGTAHIQSPRRPAPAPGPGVNSGTTLIRRVSSGAVRQYSPRQIILMGASTGGTEALKTVLCGLSGDMPGICIVQHIPAHFSRAFAERLNSLCQISVREAKAGDLVQPGLALVAPGGYHIVLRRNGSGYIVDLSEGPPLHHQRPAVDILFDSAVKAGAGPHALALLLTGMGADGAAGMLTLKEAGATTVAQDEASCVVFGMPREAIRMGAAQKVLPLDRMSGFIERHCSEIATSGVSP